MKMKIIKDPLAALNEKSANFEKEMLYLKLFGCKSPVVSQRLDNVRIEKKNVDALIEKMRGGKTQDFAGQKTEESDRCSGVKDASRGADAGFKIR